MWSRPKGLHPVLSLGLAYEGDRKKEAQALVPRVGERGGPGTEREQGIGSGCGQGRSGQRRSQLVHVKNSGWGWAFAFLLLLPTFLHPSLLPSPATQVAASLGENRSPFQGQEEPGSLVGTPAGRGARGRAPKPGSAAAEGGSQLVTTGTRAESAAAAGEGHRAGQAEQR